MISSQTQVATDPPPGHIKSKGIFHHNGGWSGANTMMISHVDYACNQCDLLKLAHFFKDCTILTTILLVEVFFSLAVHIHSEVLFPSASEMDKAIQQKSGFFVPPQKKPRGNSSFSGITVQLIFSCEAEYFAIFCQVGHSTFHLFYALIYQVAKISVNCTWPGDLIIFPLRVHVSSYY